MSTLRDDIEVRTAAGDSGWVAVHRPSTVSASVHAMLPQSMELAVAWLLWRLDHGHAPGDQLPHDQVLRAYGGFLDGRDDGLGVPALSVYPPWSTLLACMDPRLEQRHRKAVETREGPAWAPGGMMSARAARLVGRRIAIHATKRADEDAVVFLRRLGVRPYAASEQAIDWLERVRTARGAIVATARLDSLVAVDRPTRIREAISLGVDLDACAELLAGGAWASRVGLVLREVVACWEPVAVRGQQGWWHLPLDVEREVLAQTTLPLSIDMPAARTLHGARPGQTYRRG